MTACVEQCDVQQMCSLISRKGGEDPIGTAGSYERYLLVEIPTPWERDASQSRAVSPELREVLAEAERRGLGLRFLALVPDEEMSPPGYTRVIHLRRPPAPFATYEKEDYLVPSSEVAMVASAILLESRDLGSFERCRQDTRHIRDLLVCTHGSRDACCAKFGYPLYRVLRDVHVPLSGGKIRAWRTSHLGGHRFAPTLLDLPEGRYWAHLDDSTLEALLTRSGAVPQLRECYRGWGGLETLFEQAVERAIFEQEGWEWVDYLKAGSMLTDLDRSLQSLSAEPGQAPQVRISFVTPDGHISGAFEATVEATDEMTWTKGSCGDTELNGKKVYRVDSLTKRYEQTRHHQSNSTLRHT